jgi:hypothetical protein
MTMGKKSEAWLVFSVEEEREKGIGYYTERKKVLLLMSHYM